jgi:outer membrane protein assembly factor BamB
MHRPLFARRSLAAFSLVCLFAAADWSRFRGPGGLGLSDETGLPTTWSSTENIAWKTKLPGPGSSSPVIAGERIFLTCYSGYALEVEEPGDIKKLTRHIVALDRKSGKPLWEKTFANKTSESEYSGGNNTWHGYATSTPVVDDKNLYVFFGASGVGCFSQADGSPKWHADVGSQTHGWGSGNSLVLFDNFVIVNASIESGELLALNKNTGKKVWSVGGMKGARNTPNLVTTKDGKTELVVSLPGSPDGKLVAYDPKTGKELWTCRGIPDQGYVCPSVVAHDGVIYAIGGRKNTAIAVRAGGKGDVTDSHVLWRVGKGSNVSSPAYHDGRLYWIHERQGTLICLDAKTGDVVFEERVEPRPGICYSSVTIADGKIYAVSQHEGTYVFDAGAEFKQLAQNKLDDSRANACLAVDGGRLLLRDDTHLYAIGK